MKKLLFSFFLTLSVSLSVVGQISLDYTTSSHRGEIDLINTSVNGFKLIGTSYLGDTVTIYNINGIVQNTVLLTNSSLVYFSFQRGKFIPSVSDKLFNSDNQLEFLVQTPVNGGNVISVMNENGQLQYTFPDTVNSFDFLLLTYYNNQFKLVIKTKDFKYKFYSLPGTLPCDQCGGISGLEQPNTGGLGEMKVYPNPFNNTLQVNYDFPTNQSNPRLILTDILGRELREIKLTSQLDNVSINTSDLPKGTIIVSLYGGQNMISKKVIKID